MRGASIAVLMAGLGVSVAALAQPVTDKHPFQPGDLVSFGPNSYPPGAIYKVVSCEAPTKPYRQCGMIRQSPDPETHIREFTMENYREMSLAGRSDATAAAPAAPRPVAPAPTAAATPTPAMGGNTCPRSPYGGPVAGTRPASAALFQQKITDTITMGAYGPYWYGVELKDFSVGSPIRNTVSAKPGAGAVRVNTGAPPNSLMYPVSTTMSVCEGAPAGSSSWRTSQKKYLCFVSSSNEWTCGASN